MEVQITPSRSRMRQPRRANAKIALFLIAAMLLLLAASALVTFFVWRQFAPNARHVPPEFNGLAKPIFIQGKIMPETAIGTAESLRLPLPVVQQWIDPTIVFDDASQSVILTTKQHVVQLKTAQLTAMVNHKPFALSFPVEKSGETVYIPIAQLKQYYHLTVSEQKDTGAVLIFRQGDAISWARAISYKNRTVKVRTKPTARAPIVAELAANEAVMVWEDVGGWFKIQLENGIIGYARKQEIKLDHMETVPFSPEPSPYIPWSPIGGKINLTWEQVYGKNPDTAKIGNMPGLNVISPTWFQFAEDKTGEIYLQNKADAAYAKWAHDRGYQIWALFSNGFNPDWTAQMLKTYDSRQKIIDQLLSFAQLYHLQGINIDFENVRLADGHLLTQFVREFTPLAHEQGLVVSIDVTVRGGSEMWSQFYEREALGEIVDYMIVMAYDEHWASSPQAGSVASLPWTEKGVADIIKFDHVPAEKLLLGVPLYTRIWTEKTVDGKTEVSSKAISMAAVSQIIAEKKLKPTFDQKSGQYYVEFGENGAKNKIWIENAASMQSRIQIVKKYGLAGIASWSRNFDTPEIWNAIADALKQMP
ncbi:MAG TPA: glycosyl hydrolase family 18 protein [Bacilli bacterium]